LKNILFIIPYPPGSAPSQRFRFEQYFEILKKNQYNFDLAPFWSEKGWKILYRPERTVQKSIAFLGGVLRRFTLLGKINSYDFVFIHREAVPLGPPIIEFILTKLFRKKIIYDFDDAVWLPNTSDQNSIAGRLKFHHKVRYICTWSYKVSCGNEFLADFAKTYNDKVLINPTTIDTAYHKPKKSDNQKKTVTIGWTGSHSTTKYLNRVTSVLKKLKENYPVNIIVISDQPPAWDFHDFEFVKWNAEEETDQLNRIDIGIMPLDNTAWELGKCGFKALQYIATGIPAVVSDVGVNSQIIDHGINGFLCENQEDWEKHLAVLTESAKKRKEFGEQGRKKVIESYSVISNEALFLSLFE
jgi:glycosyltransferase involved in cell wall biosynthesis